MLSFPFWNVRGFRCLFQGFMLQLLETFESIHKHGIIHRDVKLENFLVDYVSGRVKVADFGLAVQLTRNGLEPLL